MRTTFFLFEVAFISQHGQQRGMNDPGGREVVREWCVDAVEEGVEAAEANGVHAFGFGGGVVFEEFDEEDLI